jgi:hypothetical protein
MAAPATMQSEAMRRSGRDGRAGDDENGGAMRWGFPRSGGGRRL